jgi:hypothetical protein
VGDYTLQQVDVYLSGIIEQMQTQAIFDRAAQSAPKEWDKFTRSLK